MVDDPILTGEPTKWVKEHPKRTMKWTVSNRQLDRRDTRQPCQWGLCQCNSKLGWTVAADSCPKILEGHKVNKAIIKCSTNEMVPRHTTIRCLFELSSWFSHVVPESNEPWDERLCPWTTIFMEFQLKKKSSVHGQIWSKTFHLHRLCSIHNLVRTLG